jgi:hypothetical protein
MTEHSRTRRRHPAIDVVAIALFALAAAALLAISALSADDAKAAPGTGTLLGTDALGANLITVSTVTGVGSVVGPMGLTSAPALAIDPTTGIVYAGRGGGIPNLYTVANNGATTLVGSSGLGFAAIGDMDFKADGTLFAAVNIAGASQTGSDNLATIDKATGAATIIGSFGVCTGVSVPSIGAGSCTIEGMEGIAFDAAGTLYGSLSAHGAAGMPGLYTINLTTGAATFVAPIDDGFGAPSGGVVSLHFACNGTLYGGTARAIDPETDGGRLGTIDPTTGQFSFVGTGNATTGGTSLAALAFQNMPCPAPTPDLGGVAVRPLRAPSRGGNAGLLAGAAAALAATALSSAAWCVRKRRVSS